MLKNKIAFIVGLLFSTLAIGQDLESLATEDSVKEKEYTIATFKATRIISGHSIETSGKHILQFLIQHRFGTIERSFYDFFGLDNATIRLGLEYGITDRVTVGIGRSTMFKAVDGFAKAKVLRQASGGSPLSITFLTCAAVNTVDWSDPTIAHKFEHRMNYTSQLLIARKFSRSFSLQVMPSWVHLNLTSGAGEKNDIFALGIGGRFKVTKSMAITSEYYLNNRDQIDTTSRNPFSIGIDIETGGHVFQLHFTNCVGIIEHQFITKTSDDWMDRKFRFGFNISRVFNLGKKKRK